MSIGEKIKEERKKQKLKQYELARKADISNTYLSDIETGRTIPSLKSLQKIATALQVQCTEFLQEQEEIKK